jgi:hypothetical protein
VQSTIRLYLVRCCRFRRPVRERLRHHGLIRLLRLRDSRLKRLGNDQHRRRVLDARAFRHHRHLAHGIERWLIRSLRCFLVRERGSMLDMVLEYRSLRQYVRYSRFHRRTHLRFHRRTCDRFHQRQRNRFPRNHQRLHDHRRRRRSRRHQRLQSTSLKSGPSHQKHLQRIFNVPSQWPTWSTPLHQV